MTGGQQRMISPLDDSLAASCFFLQAFPSARDCDRCWGRRHSAFRRKGSDCLILGRLRSVLDPRRGGSDQVIGRTVAGSGFCDWRFQAWMGGGCSYPRRS
ncbi:hypothetical protein BHE74_00038487 [Ensete ventricosum]|nr:hypothetical protein BHE74_00038487 [Ensete ventricosum]RZS10330.1 hypothetical protein BHM03_00041542 [Ensete ventricosum]